ncbi:hypothetical protein K402DRAFT_344359 [Aulographum hederae CBS 113979]|uniref:Mitochondrial intermembrane space import and assembly protein 40 n=1 Tax=Aulographum hederae CBS 113979 TaxID=1176131 RepID=A0A6G1HGM5_9PEZI|nr:hypothetical protein K402DRAFT_344359 [Aulographum hederae CBS 113979]
MFRPASRALLRTSTRRPFQQSTSRFITTAPADKSRSWKSFAARWGVVGAIIYYYNTTDVFAEEPRYEIQSSTASQEGENLPTIDSITAQRKQRLEATQPAEGATTTQVTTQPNVGVAPGSPEALEEEAGQEGAFNPETGEINWDCPCLGGMAHGPCGEEFRAAFSCFVFSKEEPKGMDCISKFKGMQDCFRAHPDIYGAELDDEEEEEGAAAPAPAPEVGTAGIPGHTPENAVAREEPAKVQHELAPHEAAPSAERPHEPTSKPAVDASEGELVPKKWHEA